MDGLRSVASSVGEIRSSLGESVVSRTGGRPSIAVEVVAGGSIEEHSVEIAHRSNGRVRFEPGPAVVRERRGRIGRDDFPYAAHVAAGETDLALGVRSGESSEIAVVGCGGQAHVGRASARSRIDVGLRRDVVARGGERGCEMGSVYRHRSRYRIDLPHDVGPCGTRYLGSGRCCGKSSPDGGCERGPYGERGRADGESDSFFQTFREIVHGSGHKDGDGLVGFFEVFDQRIFFVQGFREFLGNFVGAFDEV